MEVTKKWKPRFTLRWIMAAVAIVALLLGVFEEGRRWERASVTVFQMGALRVMTSQRDLDDDVIDVPPPTGQEAP